MPGETQIDDPSDIPFDIIGTWRGIVGGVVGVDDWDVSRMREAKEIILYDFGGRQQAFDGCVGLQRAQDMRLADIDRHFNPGCTVILGEGVAPPENVAYPIKVRVLAPHGFTHDNIRTFERCAELIEDEAWGELPQCKVPRTAKAPVSDLDEEAPGRDGAGEAQLHLGASPRLEPEQRRAYAKPMFPVPVIGFRRRLRAGYKGKDEDGNPVEGWTWVKEQTRFKDLLNNEDGLGQADAL